MSRHSPSDLLSQSALAKRIGVSRQYINQLVAEGTIRLREDGLIDYDQAMASMEAMRDPAQPRKRKGAAPTDGDDPLTAKTYQAARLFKERYAGLRVKLDYDRACGALIPAEEVLLAWQQLVGAFRARCLTLPSKLAPQLVGHDINYIKGHITTAVYEALEELSRYDMSRSGNSGSDEEKD